MVTQVLEQAYADEHIRRFSPSRDMAALAELIEIAFSQELAATGSDIVREIRQLAMLGPALWLNELMGPALTGFVWIENGKLVGNVSLNESDTAPGTWFLSNVAVLPDYRRRGIATHLMETAIADLRSRRARRLTLQVRNDNAAAIAIYHRFGFARYDTFHELSLPRLNWPLIVGDSSLPLRRVRARDQQALRLLAIESIAAESRPYQSFSARAFRRGIGWRIEQALQMAFNGRERRELVGEQDSRIVAYGALTLNLFKGPHEMELYVAPHQRGLWETPLMAQLIAGTTRVPHFSITANFSTCHPEAVQAAHELGFRTLRVLDQMALELESA